MVVLRNVAILLLIVSAIAMAGVGLECLARRHMDKQP